MKKSKLYFLLLLSVLFLGAIFLRRNLLELGLPSGVRLETLADDLRNGSISAADAVAAFCRDLINDGTN